MMELRNFDMTEYHWNSTIITYTSVHISNILKYFKRRGRTTYSSIYFILLNKKKIILKVEKIYKYDNLTFRSGEKMNYLTEYFSPPYLSPPEIMQCKLHNHEYLSYLMISITLVQDLYNECYNHFQNFINDFNWNNFYIYVCRYKLFIFETRGNEDGIDSWIHGIRLDMLLLRDSGYRKRYKRFPFSFSRENNEECGT